MPHYKRRSLRARMITLVLIPSTVLLMLWAAFTVLLVNDIGELRATAAVTEQIGAPVVETIGALQDERRATMDSAWGTESTALDLVHARHHTDRSVLTLTRSLDHFETEPPSQVLAFQQSLEELRAHRSSVDAVEPTQLDLEQAATVYTRIIEEGLRVWDAQVGRADPAQVPHLRSLTSLMRTRELLNQQDAVLAHAVATGSFPASAHAQFAAAAGAQHYTWQRVGVELSPKDALDYVNLESHSALQLIQQLQESIISTPIQGGHTVPVNATAWRGAAEAVDTRMRDVEQGQTDHVIAFSHAQSAQLRNSVLLISVPALVAALLSTTVAVAGTQRLGLRLQHLRNTTLEHARRRLPDVTQRLRAGQDVDVETEVPRLRVHSTDEIGQVAQAFNDAQRAAVTAAVEEARLRAGVRNMFRNIARRTQTLVHRQLSLLDALERNETDPRSLEALFRIDHFSTQLRRNAENLMLLSGDTPTRPGLAPVGLYEAVRAAASEIEDYTRVRVLALPEAAVRGEAANDVVRLLSELLENATCFSPPRTQVTVDGRLDEGGGCELRVHDEGLGMTSTQLEAANALLSDPPLFDLARMREDSQLGLFVVATIAARHELRVRLESPTTQGTSAVVTIGARVLEAPESTDAADRPGDQATGGPSPEAGAPPARESSGQSTRADPSATYKGLPMRRRKPRAQPASSPAAEPGPQRSLAQIQTMMSALQKGTQRGRAPDAPPPHEHELPPYDSSKG